MGRELGRISGPLLSANLLRNGDDLWFANQDTPDPKILYLDVSSTGKVAIHEQDYSSKLNIGSSSNPKTTRTTNVLVDTRLDVDNENFSIYSNKITYVGDQIIIAPNPLSDPTVTTTRIGTANLRISDKLIENITDGSNIELTANGSGRVVFTTTKVNVDGNLHATGNITWDGDITLGNDDTDSVTFIAEIASHIIPDADNTYDLGSDPTVFFPDSGVSGENGKEWQHLYVGILNVGTSFTTENILITTLTVNQNSIFRGDSFIGNSLVDDQVTFNSYLTSNLVPTTSTHTLGTGSYRWDTVFLKDLNVDSVIDIQNNTITTIDYTILDGGIAELTGPELDGGSSLLTGPSIISGGDSGFAASVDLKLYAAGTGIINVVTSDVEITNDLTVGQLTTLDDVQITGLLDLTGDYVWDHTGISFRTGNTDITGSITVNGANTVQFDDIKFVSNRITTTIGNNDLVLLPNGTGIVKTLSSDVEITNDLNVGVFGYFNNLTVNTDISTDTFTVGDFYIDNNDIITTVGSNIDIILSANGSGKVYVPTNDVIINNDLTVIGDVTVDGSTSLKNTVIGTTLPSTAVGSAQFSGSNYLSVSGGTGTAMGTGDFTWECWVYPTSSSDYQCFIDTRTSPLEGGDDTGFYFGTNYNTLAPIYYTNGLQLESTVSMTLNSWNHVALTRNSGTVTLWVNGVSGGIQSNATDLTQQRVFIGGDGLSTALNLIGNISNLRIVKGTAVYTTPFTVPTTALTAISGTQLLLLEDTSANLLTDSSTNNFTVANNGTVAWSALSPITGGSGGTIPSTLTQIGNLDQTGNTYITGNFNNNNITVLSPSYISVPDIKIESNVISVTATNTDLEFYANGAGGVIFDRQLKITNNIIENIFDVNDINLAFNNLFLTEDGQVLLTESGDEYLADTVADRDLSIIFQPSANKNVIIDSNKALAVPYGNTTDRALRYNGDIRQNSTIGVYEGYSPSGTISFNNIYDTDKNTYVTPELTPGANDNTLRFGINGTVKATITSSSLYSNALHVDNVNITNTTISNLISSTDLEVSGNGTGSVVVNNISFRENTITNNTDDAIVLENTGTGYVKFTGTNAVIIPTGDDTTRRSAPELAETRYNSARGYAEIFDGTDWIPIRGNATAATEEEVVAETNLWAFILG